jgi:hypothetical protein
MARIWRRKRTEVPHQDKEAQPIAEVIAPDEIALPPPDVTLAVPARPEPRLFMSTPFSLSEVSGLPSPKPGLKRQRINRDPLPPLKGTRPTESLGISAETPISTFAIDCALVANAEINKHFPYIRACWPAMSHSASVDLGQLDEGPALEGEALSAALAQEISAGGAPLSQRRLSPRMRAVILVLCKSYAGLLHALVVDLREFSDAVIDELDADEVQRSEKA